MRLSPEYYSYNELKTTIESCFIDSYNRVPDGKVARIMYAYYVARKGLNDAFSVLSKERLRGGEVNLLLHSRVTHFHSLLKCSRADAYKCHSTHFIYKRSPREQLRQKCTCRDVVDLDSLEA